MSTVDTIMAGLAGTIDLSGVAIASSFYWPAYMFLAGIAYGVAPTISHLLATKNMRFMQQSLFNYYCGYSESVAPDIQVRSF